MTNKDFLDELREMGYEDQEDFIQSYMLSDNLSFEDFIESYDPN